MSGEQPDIGALFRRSQRLLSALGDPTRQEIIALLLGGPAPAAVNDIAGRVGLSQPAVSHHLRILKEAGIVTVERSGKQRLYSSASNPVQRRQHPNAQRLTPNTLMVRTRRCRGCAGRG